MPAVLGTHRSKTGERNAMLRSFYKFGSLHLLTIVLAIFTVVGTQTVCHAAEAQPAAAQLPRDSQPVWSPDGRSIAFVSTRTTTNDASGGRNIWISNSDGSDLRQVTFGIIAEYPTWSPDGTEIAYQSGNMLYTVTTNKHEPTQLTQGGKGWFAPDWNPKDFTKMLCAAKIHSLGDNDIFILNPQTCLTRQSGRQVLREREGFDERPRWSKDGTRIAFVGEVVGQVDDSKTWYLMTMRADGTGMRTHCEITNPLFRPSWLPGGDAVMIDDGKICDLATGKVTTKFQQPLQDPDVSPDGRRVAYSETIPGKGMFIFTCKMDGTDKRQITSP